MCSVYSAVSGEVLAVVDKYEGKTAKAIKQSVAAQMGVTRFRQRFFLEDGCGIEDDEVLTSEPVKIQLVLLDFLPARRRGRSKDDSCSLEQRFQGA